MKHQETALLEVFQPDYQRLTGDARPSDLALWPRADTDPAALRQAIEALRHIFDRSFAITYGLQAMAIGIGLFGMAASFDPQVLARRKEFGLLAHLGLTRRQILAVVAAEGTAWTAVGAAAGLLLGLTLRENAPRGASFQQRRQNSEHLGSTLSRSIP